MEQCQLLIPQYEILYNIERELRDLSTQLQEKYYDDRFRKRVANRVRRLIKDAIEDLKHDEQVIDDMQDEEFYDKKLSKLADRVSDIVWSLDELDRITDIVSDINADHISSDTNTIMNELEELVKDMTGNKCRYNINNAAGLVNDLASCIHRIADKLQESLNSKKIGTKCIKNGTVSDNDILVKACKEWDRLSEHLNELSKYYTDDYIKLQGRIIPNRLMLTVGSSTNHQTHLDLERGVLQYYDDDEHVLEVLRFLWEDAGLECSYSNYGLECSGLNEDNIVKAARVAATATSMDIRLNDREEKIEDEYKADEYDDIVGKIDTLNDHALTYAEREIIEPDIKYVLNKLKDIKVS